MLDLVLVLCLALLVGFALLVSFHDAPNAVALPVRVRAVTPWIGVQLSAFFNVLGLVIAVFALQGAADAWLRLPDGGRLLGIMLCTLITGCLWELFTWWRGMPSSSTHALIGGFLGTAWAQGMLGLGAGESWAAEMLAGVWAPLVAAPLLAFGLSWLLVPPLVYLWRHASPGRMNRRSRHVLVLGLSAISLGHGVFFGNRLMILALLIVQAGGASSGAVSGGPYLWGMFLVLAAAMCLGTLGGGWRIAHTLGHRLVRVDPFRAAVAQTVSAGLSFTTGMLSQSPYSSSHLTASAVLGAGSAQRFNAVRAQTAARMLLVWVATVPITAVGSAILFLAFSPLLPAL